jgi:competence protein ComEC
MSFLAVMGLIAFYEAVSIVAPRAVRNLWPHSPGGPHRHVAGLSVFAMAATTIVASVFTSLPAAYHFNRVAPYSLLANLLALPIVTSLVMPSAVIAVAAMPLGLEGLPLRSWAPASAGWRGSPTGWRTCPAPAFWCRECPWSPRS